MTEYEPTPTLQAVLADMDGLLVDSEKLWFDVEAEVMTRLGGQWTEEHQRRLVGGPPQRTVRYMLDVSGSSVPPATVWGWLMDGMAERLRAEVPLLPGAKELLDELNIQDVPCVLVTTSQRNLVEIALDVLGRHLFAAVVSGDDVTHPKPDPEPYVTAAGLLGVDPRRCVALEDSPNGVAAAEAAGCVTVAVPSVVAIEPAATRTVVASLTELSLARLRAIASGRL